MFFENCKKNIFFFFVEFLSQSKILHANSPDREKMLFYQALAHPANTRCTYKKRGFVPNFLGSPSENDSCEVRKYKLTVSFFRMKICSPDEETIA